MPVEGEFGHHCRADPEDALVHVEFRVMVGVVPLVSEGCRQEEKGARHLLLEKGHVLSAHGGFHDFVDKIRAEDVLHGGLHFFRHFAIVEKGRRAVGEGDGRLAPESLRHVGADRFQPCLQVFPGLRRKGADGSPDGAARGDDVGHGAALDGAHGNDGGIQRARFPADHELEQVDRLAGHGYRVDCQVGCGPVPTLSFEGDGEPVGGRHEGAEAVAGLTGLEALPEASDVEADDAVHGGVFEQPVLDHGGGSLSVLLRGLKDELHRSLEVVPALREDFRRTEEHGGVGVMAAGVHVAVGGGEGKSRVLGHVEGVVVRPDAEDLSGFFPLDEGHDSPHAVPVADLVRAHFFEFLDDELFRGGGVEADFRIGVECSPPPDDLVVHFLCFFLYVEHGYHLLLSLAD
ncbi:hypothetical protein SDC9_60212 [bioreactor metagenome]|uniref:Uncharacterized protein n=1 Tax=bioreactor metagenome TaxID=1076179 RepID=A0A644XCD9_9ZZZZ